MGPPIERDGEKQGQPWRWQGLAASWPADTPRPDKPFVDPVQLLEFSGDVESHFGLTFQVGRPPSRSCAPGFSLHRIRLTGIAGHRSPSG